MAKEQVIKYRDEENPGRVLSLDVANGYVYDEKGVQVAKWTPKDSESTAMLADYCGDMVHGNLVAGLRSAVGGNEQVQTMLNDRARSVAMSGPMADRAIQMGVDEKAHQMDLGNYDVHQPSAMPNYAAGYHNDVGLADVVCPVILTGKPADKYYTFAKEDAFGRATPVVGTGGGQVAEVPARLANAQFDTVEYALGGFVSTQLQAAADAALRLRQATAKRIMNSLMLEREIRAQLKLTTAANLDSSVVATIAAGNKWNGGVGSDPVADLHARIEAAWVPGLSGVLMSEKVFHALQRNAGFQKYIAYKDGQSPLPNAAEISSLVNVPFFVSKMKYINSSGTLDYIWGNDVVLFRMPDQMPPVTQDDVATAVTFRWNATTADAQISNGIAVREYFVQDRGSKGGDKIVIVHQDAEVITSKFAAGLLKSAWQ